jgi:hypothetical protein
VLFDMPTISQLSVAIAAEQVKQVDEAEAAELLEELQQLSPEEVRALLGSELNTDFAQEEL